MDERIGLLQVHVAGQPSGQLLQQSGFEYRYLQAEPEQPAVGLLMPPTRLTWHDGALFPLTDQNLPEGDLFNRLRQQFPKQPSSTAAMLECSSTGSAHMSIKFSEDVIPLGDLKVNPGRVIRHVTEAQRPALLTSRGRGVAVVQSLDAFEAAEDERQFMRAVVAGLADLDAGSAVSLQQARAHLGL